MLGCTLIVVAKSPVAGRVKTRLCPPCTPAEAAAVARAALVDTLRTVVAAPARRRLLALDGLPGPWLPAGFDVVAQPPTSFGGRLAAAFAAAGGPALLVGMDTPQLRVDDLAGAQRALLAPDVDAVLGPAADGGWWAMGLRRCDPRVFEGVPMSTSRTGEHQLRRLRALGLRVGLLPVRRDVDTFDDALAVAQLAPGTSFARCVARIATAVAARDGLDARSGVR